MANIGNFDPENPLGRCPGESLRANQALRDYALLGPGRSIRKLLEEYQEQKRVQTEYKASTEKSALRQPGAPPPAPPTTRLATLASWSADGQWLDRVAAWEELLDAELQIEWTKRRDEHRQDEWKLRSDLFELAEGILAEGPKFLQTRRRVQKDGTEIITIALDARVAIQAGELASKLGRLATDMETERKKHEHSGPGGKPIPVVSEIDLSGLDDEQLRSALAKLGGIAAALAIGSDVPQDADGAAGDDPASEGSGKADA